MVNDGRLQELFARVARKKQLDTQLRDLENQVLWLRKQAGELERISAREQADVDRLEGGSLAAFFYGVVGKMDEKLDKERQEAYAARVKADAAARELNDLEQQLQRVQNELAGLGNCEEECRRLLREKAEELKASGGQIARELLALEERIAWLRNQLRELSEARSAGEQALGSADEVLRQLESAQGWATWDVMGGGLLTDVMKYSRLDSAQNAVEVLQIQLSRFKTELADVTIETDLRVGVDGFLRFADYCFDNIFTDWAVMSQISTARDGVYRTRAQVESVLQGLWKLSADCEQELVSTQARLEELVRSAGQGLN